MSDVESDEAGLSAEEALLKRHRKEKKELQARIQNIKKTSSKGDKKKKKEATEEIAKITAEMEQRHEAELEAIKCGGTISNVNMVLIAPYFRNSSKDIPVADSFVDAVADSLAEKVTVADDKGGDAAAVGAERVSKAQKRRDKKAAKEKQRLDEIERQEEENKYLSECTSLLQYVL